MYFKGAELWHIYILSRPFKTYLIIRDLQISQNSLKLSNLHKN